MIPAANLPMKVGGQTGTKGRLFAEAASMTEEEAVATIDVKVRHYLQLYVEYNNARKAYFEVYETPKERQNKTTQQPYKVLAIPKHAAYVKLLRLRASDKAIISLDELAQWLSTKIVKNESDALKAADQLCKLAGWYHAPQADPNQKTAIPQEIILKLATPPEPPEPVEVEAVEVETTEAIEVVEVVEGVEGVEGVECE